MENDIVNIQVEEFLETVTIEVDEVLGSVNINIDETSETVVIEVQEVGVRGNDGLSSAEAEDIRNRLTALEDESIVPFEDLPALP